MTTENLKALDLSLMDATPEEISLSTRLPFFSIDNLAKQVKVSVPRCGVRVESVYVPMKRFFNPFNFKAIETKYDGYKFRSRLEARWATFFNALGIPYEYEKEGYDLEGTWYLPDFWLPQQEYFIEIKGQDPTEEEVKKARDLALFTDKLTYIIYGNIGMPDHKNTHTIRMEHPPHVYLSRIDGYIAIPTSLDARIAIQKLDELGMKFGTEVFVKGHEQLTIKRVSNPHLHLDWVESHIESEIQDLYKLRDLMPFLRKCEDEIFEIFSQNNEDQEVGITGQDEGAGAMEWLACTHCKVVCLRQRGFSNDECRDCKQGMLTNNTPRLLAAYEAARQARF